MFQISHVSKSSVLCPRPQPKPSNQIRLITSLESSPNRTQRCALASFHPGTCALPRHTCARTVPCRPGMPCCCSHSCRVRLALQWLGVGQHSPTTNPATWIPEDSNHCWWKEETVRSLGPYTFLCHLPLARHGALYGTSATLNCRSLNTPSTSCFCPLPAVLSPTRNTENTGPGCLIVNFPFAFLSFYPKLRSQIPSCEAMPLTPLELVPPP